MSKDVLTKLRSARLKEIQDPEYLDSLLGIPQAVRAALESGGHIYHRKEAVRRVLGSICNGNKKLADEEWRGLLASGLVVDVTRYVLNADRGGKWYAWRHHLEGEIAFAKAAVDHAAAGGQAIIYYGDPGTGKTHQVALEVLTAASINQNQAIGSAMNHSAGNLDAKIGELAQKQGIAMPKVKVGTIHKIYGAKVDPMKYVPKISTDIGQFVVDELGQLGSDTAGMAARRWHSDAKIVLSVGPGQLLPIGPGQIGEDLLMCLKETEDKMKGWQLKKLTENYRTKSTPGGPPPAIGIVQFFCSIAEGRVSQFEVMVTNNEQMPQGLVLFPIRPSSRGSGFGDSLEFAPAGGIMYETPGSEPRFISPLDRDGSEIIAVTFKQLKADMADRKISVGIDLLEDGEEIWLKVASSATRTARWKKGMRGTVVKTNEDGKIVIKPVSLPSQAVTAKSITVSRAQIRRYCAITAHSAQGLETDFGVVVALRSRITNKRWLYTAVSRCKRMCVVIYEEGSLDYIVNNREINTPRRTLFPTFFRMFRKERGV